MFRVSGGGHICVNSLLELCMKSKLYTQVFSQQDAKCRGQDLHPFHCTPMTSDQLFFKEYMIGGTGPEYPM